MPAFFRLRLVLAGILTSGLSAWCFADQPDDPFFPNPATLPQPGAVDLRILTPDVLQVRGACGRASWSGKPSHWAHLEGGNFTLTVPSTGAFYVRAGDRLVEIKAVGLRREPILADYHRFDLLLLTSIFLQLEKPLPEGSEVIVGDPSGKFWRTGSPLVARMDPARFSPLIHMNHAGYVPGFPKSARISGDFGTLGEMELPPGTTAALVDERGNKKFEAPLELQTEKDWKWHQRVYRFDFSAFNEPGLYRIEVPGLGRSAPVRVHDGAFAFAARLHALGMFHQRSGFSKSLPFTRIEHPASHTAPAFIPTTAPEFKAMNRNLARMAEKNTPHADDPKEDVKQTAPMLSNVDASLYPIVKSGKIDVSGGHYDAGDYSKYLTNSAQLVSALVFATDHFPGVDCIDNLGLPESGDGIPDALQIAKWEADFIAKMQDEDGGFFFLVYPKDRSYELDVLPENGDPQVVFPKNTIATAGAVGALAQCAASPAFQKAFPEDAKRYLRAAERGWEFLERAIGKHGFDGSLQIISHYGRDHGARDELCHAAAALYTATGDRKFENALREWWPDPTGGQSTKWGWLPLFGSYGCAARVYAFCETLPAVRKNPPDPDYLEKMRSAILAGGYSLQKLAVANAFGIPLSLAGKRNARIGWYWTMEFGYDLATAWLLAQPGPQKDGFLQTLIACFDFEFGSNPANRVFVSGAGPAWRRQIVNRISLNDSRVLAVSGIASGNVVSTPDNLRPYQIEGANGLRRMYFPGLADFPFYDRAALDAYNVRAEFVTAATAKILASYLLLMAQTSEARAGFEPVRATITGAPDRAVSGAEVSAALRIDGEHPIGDAVIVWEIPGRQPHSGPAYKGPISGKGPARIEVEAAWPDGRRAFAVHPVVLE